MSVPARIVCLPSRDLAFASNVGRVAERIPDGLPVGDALAWFVAELRRSYPIANVREQEELARRDGDDPVWYVTRREGRFRIDTASTVPLEPEDAYRVYVERIEEWQTVVRLTPRHDADPLVGRTYDAWYQFLGHRYPGVLRVLAADPPTSVAIEASGSGIAVWCEARFAPVAGGTHVEVKGDYELPTHLMSRIADRLGLERAIARDIERANGTYVALCETQVPVAAGEDRSEGVAAG